MDRRVNAFTGESSRFGGHLISQSSLGLLRVPWVPWLGPPVVLFLSPLLVGRVPHENRETSGYSSSNLSNGPRLGILPI